MHVIGHYCLFRSTIHTRQLRWHDARPWVAAEARGLGMSVDVEKAPDLADDEYDGVGTGLHL